MVSKSLKANNFKWDWLLEGVFKYRFKMLISSWRKLLQVKQNGNEVMHLFFLIEIVKKYLLMVKSSLLLGSFVTGSFIDVERLVTPVF